jgi:hypothetical protein
MEQVLGVDVQPTAAKQPVLEIPAIDMTSSFAETTPARAPEASGASTTKNRARSAGSKANQSSRSTRVEAPPKSRRDGSVGRDTFERVEALRKDGTSKKAAFTQIAADTGKNIGTVSANYYRVARANGTVNPRPRRKSGAMARSRATIALAAGGRRGRQNARGNGDVERLAADLVSKVEALARAMRAQSQEVADLRERLDGVRSLLK